MRQEPPWSLYLVAVVLSVLDSIINGQFKDDVNDVIPLAVSKVTAKCNDTDWEDIPP